MTLPDYPAGFWILAPLAVLLIGIAKAGFGGGIGVVATPILALILPVPQAAALLLPILICADLFTVQHYYKHTDRHHLKILLPSALVGILLGSLLFTALSENERALKISIGLLVLAFLIFQLLKGTLLTSLENTRPGRKLGLLLGTTAGFTSTLAHVGGPPLAIYLIPQQLPRHLFVGTSAVFFMVVNLIKLLPYSLLGLIEIGNLTTAALLLPIVLLGVRLGIWLNKRFSQRWFMRLIYALLLFTSLQLLLGTSLITLLFN